MTSVLDQVPKLVVWKNVAKRSTGRSGITRKQMSVQILVVNSASDLVLLFTFKGLYGTFDLKYVNIIYVTGVINFTLSLERRYSV